jgi:hypothetical protein
MWLCRLDPACVKRQRVLFCAYFLCAAYFDSSPDFRADFDVGALFCTLVFNADALQQGLNLRLMM